MGCPWQFSDTDYAKVTAIEVVNGGNQINTRSPEGRFQGLEFWQARLNEGWHITAVGGSDNHDATIPVGGFSSVGQPTTVVEAERLSTPAILKAIRAGHVFIDVEGTHDRLLQMTAVAREARYRMGDTILHSSSAIRFDAKIANVPDGFVDLIIDGRRREVPLPAADASGARLYSWQFDGDGNRHWVRLEVRSANGDLLLVGNPVYIDGKSALKKGRGLQ